MYNQFTTVYKIIYFMPFPCPADLLQFMSTLLCAFTVSSRFTTVYEIIYFVPFPCPAGLLKPFLKLSRTQPKVGLECPKVVNASKRIGLSFVPYDLLCSFCKPKDRLTTQRHLTTEKGDGPVFLMKVGQHRNTLGAYKYVCLFSVHRQVFLQ